MPITGTTTCRPLLPTLVIMGGLMLQTARSLQSTAAIRPNLDRPCVTQPDEERSPGCVRVIDACQGGQWIVYPVASLKNC